jgi:hypothetical protein
VLVAAASEEELAAADVSVQEVEAVPALEPLGMVRAAGPALAGRGTATRRSPEAAAVAAEEKAAAAQEAAPPGARPRRPRAARGGTRAAAAAVGR